MSDLRAAEADIALLLEGTYPYVSGGVSSWVHQIIRAFPEYRYALVFIGSRPEDYGDAKYQLPDNVVHLEKHFIHTSDKKPVPREMSGDPATFDLMRELHDVFRTWRQGAAPETVALAMQGLSEGRIDEANFLYSRESWKLITERYRAFSTDPSFIDYFWAVRTMHQPIWMLNAVAQSLIPVRAYHSVSTGYAGFLGALLKKQRGNPLILSEHGIYTKERKIDLFQSEWIKDNRDAMTRETAEVSYFKQLWIRFFESLGRMCYDAADPIVALYEQNRLRQVEDGAEASRTQNIPNGISIERFATARSKRPAVPPPILCLIGRVVPIKDVKTFLRAMRTVADRVPEAQGWIAGPTEEDEGYAAECRNLVESLGLESIVHFLGFQKMEEVLPKVGVLVLSSISEALPLVILEGYAAGVPVVATDVGSCRQLIEGLDDEDRALGRSGRVVGIADPEALAEAAIELISNHAVWTEAQQSGIRRVERYYTQELMIDRYRKIYRATVGEPLNAASARD